MEFKPQWKKNKISVVLYLFRRLYDNNGIQIHEIFEQNDVMTKTTHTSNYNSIYAK